MRYVQLLFSIVLLLLITLVLTACDGDATAEPSELDAVAAQNTLEPATAFPTEWSPSSTPTATAIVATFVPTTTPYPTPDPDNSTPEPLDNYVLPGDWLYQIFVDADGQTHTLEEYLGRVVIIQTMSLQCPNCLNQQRAMVEAAKTWLDKKVLGDTVFITLGTLQAETPSLLASVTQNNLPEEWATIEILQSADSEADWLYGIASETLVDELERAFTPDISSSDIPILILIQRDGLGHLISEEALQYDDLTNIILYYISPPDFGEPLADEE
ncbi:MAG: hypothetical protein JW966_09855 [Anaerolineae bacterium]|nr:hypothetical protein [Anaerolineae bacterium]